MGKRERLEIGGGRAQERERGGSSQLKNDKTTQHQQSNRQNEGSTRIWKQSSQYLPLPTTCRCAQSEGAFPTPPLPPPPSLPLKKHTSSLSVNAPLPLSPSHSSLCARAPDVRRNAGRRHRFDLAWFDARASLRSERSLPGQKSRRAVVVSCRFFSEAVARQPFAHPWRSSSSESAALVGRGEVLSRVRGIDRGGCLCLVRIPRRSLTHDKRLSEPDGTGPRMIECVSRPPSAPKQTNSDDRGLPPPPDQQPQQQQHYRYTHMLGDGTYGTVWLAETRGELVAVRARAGAAGRGRHAHRQRRRERRFGRGPPPAAALGATRGAGAAARWGARARRRLARGGR